MTKKYAYDVIYIGRGHASFDGAELLAKTGQKVALITDDLIGGTCTNRGCNAKITLDAPVNLQRAVNRMQGLVHGEITIDWPALVAHKKEVIKDLPQGTENKLTNAGVEIFRGHASLIGPHTVQIDGQTKYSAEKIVIGTGQHPNRLQIPGSELAHDSSEFMDLTEMPHNIAIVGAGYISYEFATIANAVGANVTVFMHGDQGLRNFYQTFVKKITADLADRGVKFIHNAQVGSFTKNGQEITVHYGNGQTAEFDWLLDATGRVPNVNNMGLKEVGVKYSKRGIKVNDYLQTSVQSIYAAGDVLDKSQPKLTPTATFESYYLYQLFSGQNTNTIKYPAIPTTVYTSPRIAQVGVTPAQAKQGDFEIVENHIPDDWYRQIDQETIGDRVLVFDKEHHLIGVTEFSDKAEDAVNTYLPAIVSGYDDNDMWQMAHIFPSVGASAWHKIR